MDNDTSLGITKDILSEEIKPIIVPLLDFFSLSQDLVIAMYTINGNELWTTKDNCFSPLCNYIKSKPELWQICHKDHADRTQQSNFIISPKEKLGMCHLGLWNIVQPLFNKNVFYGALITGQRRLSNPESDIFSLNLFNDRLNDLKNQSVIDAATEDELRRRFNDVPFIDAFPQNCIYALASVEKSLIGVISDIVKRISRITLLRHEIHEPNTAARGILCESRDMIKNIINNPNANVGDVESILNDVIQNISYGISNSILFSSIVENICSSLKPDDRGIIPSNCNIPLLLTEAQKIFEGPAGDKSVIFEPIKRVNLNRESISADKTLLMQAFMNIYHNAVKYSYYGQGEDKQREILTTCVGLDNYIRITVSNYGLGILPDEQAKIFEEGYRGKLSCDRHRTGSGLGLYQVKKIIRDLHHGNVDVESWQKSQSIAGPYLTKIHLMIPYKQ
jgi:signal transduction histidine kinase